MVSQATVGESGNTYVRAITGSYKLEGTVTYAFASEALLPQSITWQSLTTNDLEAIITGPVGYDGSFEDISNYSLMVDAVISAYNAIQSYCNVEFQQASTSDNPYQYVFGMDNMNYVKNGDLYASRGVGSYVDLGDSVSFVAFDLVGDNGYSITYQSASDGVGVREENALHEILHAIGLYHPHDNDDDDFETIEGFLDNTAYTVMSYNKNSLAGDVGHAITPMALDVAALHHLYGAKDKALEDTVYTILDNGGDLDVNETDGSIAVGRAYFCIWDTGGVDAISYAGSDYSCVINLNEATLTSVMNPFGDALKNIISASEKWGALPEDVKAQFANPELAAGGYISTLFTSAGMRDGGFTIAATPAGFQFSTGIENAIGGGNDDLLIGNFLSNEIMGNGGDDFIYGDAGGDTLLGGDGNDEVHGGEGFDTISGGAGNDKIHAGEGGGLIIGGSGDDEIHGGGSNVFAGDGDDYIGQSAGGILSGERGNDYFDLSASSGGRYLGGTGNDVFDLTGFSVDSYQFHIDGGAGHDILYVDSLEGILNGEIFGGLDFSIYIDRIEEVRIGWVQSVSNPREWQQTLSSKAYTTEQLLSELMKGDLPNFSASPWNDDWDTVISCVQTEDAFKSSGDRILFQAEKDFEGGEVLSCTARMYFGEWEQTVPVDVSYSNGVFTVAAPVGVNIDVETMRSDYVGHINVTLWSEEYGSTVEEGISFTGVVANSYDVVPTEIKVTGDLVAADGDWLYGINLAVDQFDFGNPVEYRVISESSDNFFVDEWGDLYSIAPLDYGTNDVIDITVEAFDGTTTLIKTISIQELDGWLV